MATTADAIGVSGDFDNMTDSTDRLAGIEEVTCDTDQIAVVADVFRCPAGAEVDAQIVIRVDVGKSDVGFERIALHYLVIVQLGFTSCLYELIHFLLRASYDQGDFQTPITGHDQCTIRPPRHLKKMTLSQIRPAYTIAAASCWCELSSMFHRGQQPARTNPASPASPASARDQSGS